MIRQAKTFLKRRWPALRLRTILFGVLLFVATLPGVSAVFLRVYENTLVRQTEAELIAQGAALAATAQAVWPGRPEAPPNAIIGADFYRPEPLSIDLGTTPVLPERPPAQKLGSGASSDANAEAAAKLLAPILKETSRTTLASIVLTDERGLVLVGPDAGESYATLPEVRGALAGTPQTVLRRNGAYQPRYAFEWLSRASPLRIHHVRPIFSGGRVVGVLILSRSSRALFRGIYQDRAKILLGIALIGIALAVLSALVSRGITRPIEALSAASRRVATGHGVIPDTPETAAVEIRALYRDFRIMAEAIARRSSYLRDFAAAVSHEFKTPLAGIRGATELLQDHHVEMSESERQHFLANIAADATRLSQLVARLLDLARADMTRPETGVATDVCTPVLNVVDALRSDALNMELRLPPDLPAVAVPASTIEAVLTTVIDNSRQAGSSTLVIQGMLSAAGVILEVADDGPGIPQGDRDLLFEPFFTSKRSSGGTGLGLSIASSLLAASQGEMRLIDSEAGAKFAIVLPLSANGQLKA